MNRVFIDTAPFIYLLERDDELNRTVYQQFENWFESNSVLLTSVLTLAEVLVYPKQKKQVALENKYKYLIKEMLSEPLVAMDEEIADKSVFFRVKYKLKMPDAIQVATAIQTGCDIFYTNDKDLKKVKEIKIITV